MPSKRTKVLYMWQNRSFQQGVQVERWKVQGITKLDKAQVHRLSPDASNQCANRSSWWKCFDSVDPQIRVPKQRSWDRKSPVPLAFSNDTYTLLLLQVCSRRVSIPLTYLGTFPASLELGDRKVDVTVTMLKEVKGALLSWFDVVSLGILPDYFRA